MICQRITHVLNFYYAGVDIGYIIAAVTSATVLIIIGIMVSTCILFVWIQLQKSYQSSTSQNLKSNAKVMIQFPCTSVSLHGTHVSYSKYDSVFFMQKTLQLSKFEANPPTQGESMNNLLI